MKKLTNKIKYKIIDGDLFLYGLVDGKIECVGSCHLSWLEHIKDNGFKECFKMGLVISNGSGV